MHPNFARRRLRLAPNWPPQVWTVLADVGQPSTSFGLTLPMWAPPTLAPMLAKIWPKVGPHLPMFVEVWPMSAEVGPSWANFGQRLAQPEQMSQTSG